MNQVFNNFYYNIDFKDVSYLGIWRPIGWLLHLFDRTLLIQDHTQSYYVTCSHLIEKITSHSNKALSPHLLATSKTIQRLFKEILNPVLGKPTTIQSVHELMHHFQCSPAFASIQTANEDQFAIQAASEELERFKTRSIEVLPYDPVELEKRLKPGDIFFRKQHETNPHLVTKGQRLTRPFIWGPVEREGFKYSHVAIYLGNGKIAEASPSPDKSEVRVIPLTDSHFALALQSKNGYVIARPTDEKMGLEAARVAARVATELKPDGFQETTHKYTELHAGRSIYHPSFFGPFARHRYLEQYIDDHKNQLPKDFIGLKDFFCSYFVGYCYQTAESRKIMPAILGNKHGPITGFTSIGSSIFRDVWARVKRIQYWKEMSKAVQYTYDAKWLTPQDFRNFNLNHPKLFKDVYLVTNQPHLQKPVEEPLSIAAKILRWLTTAIMTTQ